MIDPGIITNGSAIGNCWCRAGAATSLMTRSCLSSSNTWRTTRLFVYGGEYPLGGRASPNKLLGGWLWKAVKITWLTTVPWPDRAGNQGRLRRRPLLGHETRLTST